MDADELELYRKHTGRQAPPTKAYDEAWLVCGRRGGKSRILALIAVYLACFRDYRPYLASGEVGTVRLMAVDRDQARAIFRFIAGFLRETPALKRLVARETADSFELTNRTIIEVGTALSDRSEATPSLRFWPTRLRSGAATRAPIQTPRSYARSVLAC